MNGNPVDFDLIGHRDEEILPPMENPGLNEAATLWINGDLQLRGGHLKPFAVDEVRGGECGVFSELLDTGLFKGLNLCLRHTTLLEYGAHLPNRKVQGLWVSALLVLGNAFPKLLVYPLNDIVAAGLIEGNRESVLEGFPLLGRGQERPCVKNLVDEVLMNFFLMFGIEQGMV